jgi:hypothetical protein
MISDYIPGRLDASPPTQFYNTGLEVLIAEGLHHELDILDMTVLPFLHCRIRPRVVILERCDLLILPGSPTSGGNNQLLQDGLQLRVLLGGGLVGVSHVVTGELAPLQLLLCGLDDRHQVVFDNCIRRSPRRNHKRLLHKLQYVCAGLAERSDVLGEALNLPLVSVVPGVSFSGVELGGLQFVVLCLQAPGRLCLLVQAVLW